MTSIPQANETTARFSFIVPTLNIPINIPVAVRTGSDYGFALPSQASPNRCHLAGADLTLWGFPRAPSQTPSASPKAHLAIRPAVPVSPMRAASRVPTPASIVVHPLTDNPTTCTGQPLTTTLDVQTYQDPGNLSHAEDTYPATTGCEKETFNPFSTPARRPRDRLAPRGSTSS